MSIGYSSNSLLLAGCAILVSITSPALAQDFSTYGVTDWHTLVPEKRIEFQTYRTITLSNSTLDDEEKARRVAAKYAAMEKQVRETRTDAFKEVQETVGIGNSATKGSSGGDPKVVEAKCRGSDKPNMYTQPGWAKGAYQSGGADADARVLQTGGAVPSNQIVASNGAVVCAIRLKQSGKGRKVAYSEAVFRIRPGAIKSMVDAEVPQMMAEITKSPL